MIKHISQSLTGPHHESPVVRGGARRWQQVGAPAHAESDPLKQQQYYLYYYYYY